MAGPVIKKAFEMPPLSQCKSPAQPPPSTYFDHKDLITLKVVDGAQEETFSIARGLLRWHSAFFAAALDPDGSFKESSSNEIQLKEEIPVVRAFHCWLYTGRLLDPPKSKDTSGVEEYHTWPLLCKIWVFADFRGIPSFKNAAIDMLHEQVAAKWELAGNIGCVYQNSSEGSQSRKFIVDVFCKTKDQNAFLEMKKNNPPSEFLWDAILVLLERGNNFTSCSQPVWAKLDRCVWHDHSRPGGKLRTEGRL